MATRQPATMATMWVIVGHCFLVAHNDPHDQRVFMRGSFVDNVDMWTMIFSSLTCNCKYCKLVYNCDYIILV